MATAAYAVLDPDTSRLRWATAGHLPPLVTSKAGTRTLEVTPAAPLGAFRYGSCPEHELVLSAGETLVLYTDGLIERRGVALNLGIDRLVEAISSATSAEDICRRAVDRLLPTGALRDDVAIVALQHAEIPAELAVELPADPNALSTARRLVRRWLRGLGAGEDLIAEVTIAVSEACTNAVEHAYPPGPASFMLTARAANGEVLLSVRDTGRWRAARGAHRGRGLAMIEAAMDHLEVETGEHGTEIRMRRRLETE
jgi:anti-sigma regulatory factor (Ser/Thr protein kinase)